MRNLAVIAVGKCKEPFWRQAQQEYLTRLTPYAKLTVTEVAASSFGGSVTAAQSMKEEGERLRAATPKNAITIALDRKGKTLSSMEFAALLKNLGESGEKIVFIVGSSAGIDRSLIDDAKYRLSLSAMTLPHELARIVLLEQLYRAATIIAGKSYHL